MTFIYKLSHISWWCTRRPQVNFLAYIKAFESYRITHKHTRRNYYDTVWQVVTMGHSGLQLPAVYYNYNLTLKVKCRDGKRVCLRPWTMLILSSMIANL